MNCKMTNEQRESWVVIIVRVERKTHLYRNSHIDTYIYIIYRAISTRYFTHGGFDKISFRVDENDRLDRKRARFINEKMRMRTLRATLKREAIAFFFRRFLLLEIWSSMKSRLCSRGHTYRFVEQKMGRVLISPSLGGIIAVSLLFPPYENKNKNSLWWSFNWFVVCLRVRRGKLVANKRCCLLF